MTVKCFASRNELQQEFLFYSRQSSSWFVSDFVHNAKNCLISIKKNLNSISAEKHVSETFGSKQNKSGWNSSPATEIHWHLTKIIEQFRHLSLSTALKFDLVYAHCISDICTCYLLNSDHSHYLCKCLSCCQEMTSAQASGLMSDPGYVIFFLYLISSHLSPLTLEVVGSEACSLGMQAAPSSIPTSGTFFRGDLVMKRFLQPFSLFR